MDIPDSARTCLPPRMREIAASAALDAGASVWEAAEHPHGGGPRDSRANLTLAKGDIVGCARTSAAKAVAANSQARYGARSLEQVNLSSAQCSHSSESSATMRHYTLQTSVRSPIVLVAPRGAVAWAAAVAEWNRVPGTVDWIRVLSSGAPNDRKNAIRKLQAADPAEIDLVIPALAEMLGDADTAVGMEARFAARYLTGAKVARPEQSVALLIEVLRRQSSSARSAAAVGLAEVGPAAPAAIPALIATMKEAIAAKGFSASGDGTATAGALGLIVPEAPFAMATSADAIAVLREAPNAKVDSIRWAAAEALGNFGPRAAGAIPRLRELLEDESRNVQTAAGSALEKIDFQSKPRRGRHWPRPHSSSALAEDGLMSESRSGRSRRTRGSSTPLRCRPRTSHARRRRSAVRWGRSTGSAPNPNDDALERLLSCHTRRRSDAAGFFLFSARRHECHGDGRMSPSWVRIDLDDANPSNFVDFTPFYLERLVVQLASVKAIFASCSIHAVESPGTVSSEQLTNVRVPEAVFLICAYT